MPRLHPDAGAALVVALGVLVIISAVVVGLAAAVRTTTLAAAGDYQRLALYQAAKGGVNLARAVLAQDEPADEDLDEPWATQEETELELADGSLLVVRIEDASARLNLNSCSAESLLALPGVTPEMADSLLDWRDRDDQPRDQGAELEYYQALDPPYEPANRSLERLEELLQVRGWTPGALYRPVPEAELPLAGLLAVRSGERDVNAQGETRLNLNTATEEQIRRRLQPLLGAAGVEGLLALRRQLGIFTSLGELFDLPGAQAQDAVVLDEVSVGPGGLRPTVNVNTAPLEVLAALPGADEESAQAILARREGQDGPIATRGDLLEAVGPERLRQMIDYVSTRSALFLVTATARPASGPGHCTLQATVQRTATGTQVVAWQESFRPLPSPSGELAQKEMTHGS